MGIEEAGELSHSGRANDSLFHCRRVRLSLVISQWTCSVTCYSTLAVSDDPVSP